MLLCKLNEQITGFVKMNNITKEQYEFALVRIEELLPLVDDNTPSNDRNAVELTMMSDVVIDYEKEHFSIRNNANCNI